jgi:hypothetical protein
MIPSFPITKADGMGNIAGVVSGRDAKSLDQNGAFNGED